MARPLRKATLCIVFGAAIVPLQTYGDTYVSELSLRTSDPLLYAHVVIQCTVKNLATREVTLDELGVRDMPGVTTLVKEAGIDEIKVLRGTYQDSSIIIDLNSLMSIEPNTLIGKRVILCANWKPQLGQYVVGSSRSVFVQSGAAWRRLYREGTLSQLRLDELLQSVRPDNIATEAEIALVGRVLSAEKSRVELESGGSAKVWTITLQVQESLKGDIPTKEISFIIPRGDYVPEWRGDDPGKFVAGEPWLVFLVKKDGFLVPMFGKNGLLLVDGDNLLYDRTVRYPLSLSKFESIARAANNDEK